jgi:hypothetical protein
VQKGAELASETSSRPISNIGLPQTMEMPNIKLMSFQRQSIEVNSVLQEATEMGEVLVDD